MTLVTVMDRDNHKWPGFYVMTENEFENLPANIRLYFDEAIKDIDPKNPADSPRIYFDNDEDRDEMNVFDECLAQFKDLEALLYSGIKVEITQHFQVFLD